MQGFDCFGLLLTTDSWELFYKAQGLCRCYNK